MAAAPLSYSSFRTYQECPLRWKFLYVDRLPEAPKGYFSFGRTVHTVLEELLRPLVVPAPRRVSPGESQRTLEEFSPLRGARTPLASREEMLKLYAGAWVGEGYDSPEQEAQYRSLGEEILGRYWEQLSEAPPEPVAVEEHLETSWDGVPVHGYLDRLDRTSGGGLEVVDYKTSRELSRQEAKASDQLSFYQVLVQGNYPDPVERLTLYHLRSLTPHSVPPRTPHALGELHGTVGEVADGIRQESYEPTPGRHCSRCEFRSICPEFRTVPDGERERLLALVDRFATLRAEEARLEGDLKAAADELHREAERLGVHRLPGSETTAVRQREERWRLSPESTRTLAGAVVGGLDRVPEDGAGLRRILRMAALEPSEKERLRRSASRQVRWYWALEPTDPVR